MAGFLKRLFGKGAGDQPPAATVDAATRRFGNDRVRMFDLEQSRVLNAQLHVAIEERDQNWREAFYPAAWNASIQLPAEPIAQGPDGFRYLRLDIPATGPF